MANFEEPRNTEFMEGLPRESQLALARSSSQTCRLVPRKVVNCSILLDPWLSYWGQNCRHRSLRGPASHRGTMMTL